MNPKRISKCRNISAAVTWSNKDVSVSFVDMGGVVGVYLVSLYVDGLHFTNHVNFSCICPVIDNEFRHNVVKVAVDPQTTFTIL